MKKQTQDTHGLLRLENLLSTESSLTEYHRMLAKLTIKFPLATLDVCGPYSLEKRKFIVCHECDIKGINGKWDYWQDQVYVASSPGLIHQAHIYKCGGRMMRSGGQLTWFGGDYIDIIHEAMNKVPQYKPRYNQWVQAIETAFRSLFLEQKSRMRTSPYDTKVLCDGQFSLNVVVEILQKNKFHWKKRS